MRYLLVIALLISGAAYADDSGWRSSLSQTSSDSGGPTR